MVFPRLSYAVLLLVALLVSGCAQLTGTRVAETPEEAVTRLSQERLDFLVEKEFEQAYQYMSPGYRSIKSIQVFKNEFMGAIYWQNARVKEVACEQERCTVLTEIEYLHRSSGRAKPSQLGGAGSAIKTTLTERWIRSEDKWWLTGR